MGGAGDRFEYVVWFRDERLPPDDEDYEWPAVFVIQAPDREAARQWGDRLAARRALRAEEILIGSSAPACPSDPAYDRLPVVQLGQEASDDFIGW